MIRVFVRSRFGFGFAVTCVRWWSFFHLECYIGIFFMYIFLYERQENIPNVCGQIRTRVGKFKRLSFSCFDAMTNCFLCGIKY